MVHQLICSAFHGLCPNDMMSRHLNGRGTTQDNSDDKKLHGTMCTKETRNGTRFIQTDIDLIRLRYSNGETQQAIADDFTTTQRCIIE